MGNGPSTYALIGEVLFFLLLILVLFYVMARLLAKRNVLFQAGRSVKTLGGVSLGPNKSMQLVEVGHRLFIVGVGDNVQLLDTVSDPEEIAYIREHMVVSPNVRIGQLFAWTKRSSANRGLSMQEEETWSEETPSFQQVFQEKMKRVASRRTGLDVHQEERRLDE